MELPCRTLAGVQCLIDWLTALSVHAALQMILWCLLLLNQDNTTPLYVACQKGHYDVVQTLLGAGADVNIARSDDNTTSLYVACHNGHQDVVQTLLGAGADVNIATSDDKASPLHVACQRGHQDVVQTLLGAGADMNIARSDDNATPLHVACEKGHQDVVQTLLGAGADVNLATSEYGRTPLHHAAREGRTACVERLLSTPGIDVNIKDWDNETPLYVACQNDNHAVVQTLLGAGADVNIARSDGRGPLWTASFNGHLEVVKTLIEAGANINQAEKGNATPLHVACQEGHHDVVQTLLGAGAVVNIATSNNNATPLYVACQEGDHDVVQTLLGAGANVNIATSDNNATPLYVACKEGHHEVVQTLLGAAADVNIATSDDNASPLYAACEKGHHEVVQTLLGACVDVNIQRSANNATPLHVACQEGYHDVVQILLGAGADVNIATSDDNITPLYVACQEGHHVIMQTLLRAGADVNIARSDNNATSLYVACEKGHHEVVQTLLVACVNVNIARSENNATPLYKACQEGHHDIVQMLLGAGADVNIATSDYGDTPLHLASRGDNTTCVEHLLSTPGIDVNIKDKYGDTPLHLATRGDNTTCVEHLLSTPGIDVNIKDKNGDTLLHLVAQRHQTIQLEHVLSTPGIDVNIQDKYGQTPLHFAVLDGHTTCVEHLLSSQGIDVNIGSEDGTTPLHNAAREGDTTCVECLLSTRGIDVNIRDEGGDTPLHLAVREGHTTCVEHLLSTPDIDVNIKNMDGDTALHCAAEGGHATCVECLLSTPGINVNIINSKHLTPLMVATKYDVITVLQPYSTCYDDYPVHTFNKVILCGDTEAGKSSLAKAIIESSTSVRQTGHAKKPNLDEVAKPLTAGIVSYQVQNLNSNIMLYDLAGHHSYYSSHSSLLEAISISSPSTFLMLVDISASTIMEITAQMYYWLAMINNVCHKCPQPSSVIVVGTHADMVKIDYEMAVSEEINKSAQMKRFFKKHIFEQFIALNITDHSDSLKSFLSLLDWVNEKVQKRSPAISVSNHLMYAFLSDKVESSYQEALPLSYLLSLLEKEEPRVLPTEKSEIVTLLTTLAGKGFIVFLHTDSDSWIVLDQRTLLEKVNGALFAPSFFKQHLHIASNTGIIPLEVIKDQFPNHNTAMIVQFLIQLELCQHISLEHVNTNMAPKNPSSSDLLFFPPLISEERPHFESGDISTPERCFGWLLSTDGIHQFFPNRFLHTLILKLAYELCLPDKHRTINPDIKNIQCKVWRCGISWNSVNGVSTVLELMKQSQDLFLVMSFPDSSVLNELLPVLKTIRNTLSQFCPSIASTEYIVDPSKASSVFTQNCCMSSLTRIQLSHLADAIKSGQSSVVDINNKVVDLNNWISVEPCFEHLVAIAVNGEAVQENISPLQQSSHQNSTGMKRSGNVSSADSETSLPKRIKHSEDMNIQPSLDTPLEGETALGSTSSLQQPSPQQKSLGVDRRQDGSSTDSELPTAKQRPMEEAAVFGEYYAELRMAVYPDDIAAGLLTKDVITNNEKAEVDVITLAIPARMDKLLAAVQRAIRVHKNKFHIFLEVLLGAGDKYKILVEKMKARLTQ